MAEISCRHFSGYRPCPLSATCDRACCAAFSPVTKRILLIHLGALGAILRSTSLIAGVRRAYPGCALTWVTETPALLQNLGLERVLGVTTADLLALSALEFDLALVVDKSLTAAGILRITRASEVRGFCADRATGAIVPANIEAEELWQLGLSNAQKFFVNKKTEQHLTHEALALGAYRGDPYRVVLDLKESELSRRRKENWSMNGKRMIIGINTGSSPTLAAKKMTVYGHRELIEHIRADPILGGCAIVLLGGREDQSRNEGIARGLNVIVSPQDLGLRDGLASVDACDLVFSGDSLGMHMAIGLGKWTVAWFGPSCAHEIDLYGRGVKIMADVPCSPCWKRHCQRDPMCYDRVDSAHVVGALNAGIRWLTSSFKPPSPAIFSSPSPC